MSARDGSGAPVPEIVCGALLVAAFALGCALPLDPDFDATFGLEAYRSFGGAALAAASAVLAVVLLVPRVADAIAAGAGAACRRVPPVLRTPLLVVAMTTLFLTLTDTSRSGDGIGVVHQACLGDVSGSSPLSSWIHIGAVRALPLDPLDSIRLVSCAAGALYVALAVWAGRALFERPAERAALTALLLTCGSAAVFFGTLEIYALPVAGTLLFLLLALRRVAGADHRPWPALVLGALAALHGSALALVPALLYVVWTAPGPSGRPRAAAASCAAFAAPLVVVAGVLFATTWGGALPGAGDAGNALGAQGQGPFLPFVASSFNLTHRYALLDPEHLVGLLNLLFLVGPAGLLLAVAGSGRGPRVTAAALALAGLLALALVWNLSYTLRRDWDLFATLGVPLTVLGALRFLPGATGARAVRVTALSLFAFVPFVLGHAGGREQQRLYADDVITTYGWIVDGDAPLAGGMRERVSAARDAWLAREKQLDPDDVGRKARAMWRSLEKGRDAAALALADEILALDPANPDGLQGRAEVLLGRGNADEARALLTAALRSAREDLRPRARRMLARVALEEGRPDDAVRQLERGLREEVAWDAEAVALLQMLADLRRARGEVSEAEWLDRMAERRTTTGLK